MSGVTKIDAAGFRFIAGWEGGQSSDGLYHAYWDEFGHVWTIGIGETEAVHPGEVWTPAQAEADFFTHMARDYAPYINRLGVKLNHNEFNATASAIWNLGPGSLEWDWGRALKAGNFRDAAALLRKYDTAGGVVLEGLQRRRDAEAALMLTPEPKPVNPYALYPTNKLSYGGETFDERRLAKRIDQELEHPREFRKALRRDLELAKAARSRIALVSENEPPKFEHKRKKADWSDERGIRFQEWSKRIARMEKAL